LNFNIAYRTYYLRLTRRVLTREHNLNNTIIPEF